MKNQLITITTDFEDGFATSQLRAVMASCGYFGQVVENHDVNDYDILEGAYGIWQISKFCPVGSVHVGVVDPGVGSKRMGMVVKTKNFWLVGPNNGILWPTIEQHSLVGVWKIDEAVFGEVAKTFHGRDVFIKVAVKLSKGEEPESFGAKIIDTKLIKKLIFDNGIIVHIDSYGNVKFFWNKEVKSGEQLWGIPVVNTFSEVEIGKPLILNGSSDLLELAINQGSAKDYFKLKSGENLCKSIT